MMEPVVYIAIRDWWHGKAKMSMTATEAAESLLKALDDAGLYVGQQHRPVRDALFPDGAEDQ